MGLTSLLITVVCYFAVAVSVAVKFNNWHDFWIFNFYAAANLVWAHKLFIAGQ